MFLALVWLFGAVFLPLPSIPDWWRYWFAYSDFALHLVRALTVDQVRLSCVSALHARRRFSSGSHAAYAPASTTTTVFPFLLFIVVLL